MHIDGHFTPGFFFEQPVAFKTTPVPLQKTNTFYIPWSCQSKLNLNQQFGHLDLNFQRFLHFLWINGVIVRKLKTDIIGLRSCKSLSCLKKFRVFYCLGNSSIGFKYPLWTATWKLFFWHTEWDVKQERDRIE